MWAVFYDDILAGEGDELEMRAEYYGLMRHAIVRRSSRTVALLDDNDEPVSVYANRCCKCGHDQPEWNQLDGVECEVMCPECGEHWGPACEV